ncbi:MAG: Na+ dependent nucleoside transporter N-terminal domain-containing protein, partial [Ignavibacteria bacterium]
MGVILENAIGILGIIFILFLCWLLSENKRAFPWKMVLIGLSLQVLIALFIMKV